MESGTMFILAVGIQQNTAVQLYIFLAVTIQIDEAM